MSNFQPLGQYELDPFNATGISGPDAHSGIYLDVDQANSSVLIETNNVAAMYIDKFQNMGINTVSPSAQLDINSSNGTCIQLTYNGSGTNKANMSVTSDGKLVLMAGGTEVNVDNSSNFNIKSHNGANAGLLLGNSLVLASADQLNFNVVTPGTASNSKALVLNSAGSIAGINSVSASSLSGTIATAYQPILSSVDVLDVVGHTGLAGLSLGGILVTSTAAKLNYTDTTPGVSSPTKALVVDSNRNITNINSLTASQLTGTLQTAAQPNITSLGSLTGLNMNGALTGITDLSINTIETGRTLVVNSDVGNCVRMYYNASAGTTKFVDLLVDGFGNLNLNSSGGNVDITSHDGSSQGLKLGSVLVIATADQINYLEGTTPGSVSAGKAMIIDSNRNITNINSMSASSLIGTLQTATQPNISSVSALNITSHNGSTLGLRLNGTLVSATADQLNYVNTTAGAAEASKALVLNASKDISGIHALSADELTGTIQTPAQPNITSVGTLSSISTSGTLTMGMTIIGESEISLIDGIVLGVASAGKALVVDLNSDITGINSLTANELTGTLQTTTQPNIRSVTTLNITGANGSTAGLELNGILVTAVASELNYVDTTAGTAEALKALVLDSNKNISNITSLSATSLTGTLQTASQPNITSVGTLSSLSIGGDVTVGTTTISESELAVLDGVSPGIVTVSKALVVDASKNIGTINSLTTVSLVATNVTGTLQTAYQPNVTSVNTVDITSHDGTTQGLSLGGVLLTATATQINSIFGAGGQGTFQNLTVNDTLTLSNADGTSKGLILGSTLVTASGVELNYIDGSTPGTVVESKAVVVDANKDIASFRNLTALNLTGTLQTVAQPNITSVGALTSLSVVGDITVGAVTISAAELGRIDGITPGTAAANKALVLDGTGGITGVSSISVSSVTLSNELIFGQTTVTESELAVVDSVTPGTASASKVLVLDSLRDIANINSLSASTLTGTLQTAAQPNITSVGTLTSVTTSGALTLGTTTINESEIAVLDTIVPGTVTLSKAVVVDANKDISSFRNLTALNLTGTLQTATQPNVTSVNTLDVSLHDGTTQGLQLNGSLVTSTATELNYLDGSVPGTVVPSAAVVVDGNKDISSFRNLTAVTLTSTSGSLTMGGTNIDETEIEVLNAITRGTASPFKALVVDTSKNISEINSLSASSLTSTAGSLTMGATSINESEIAVLDAVVPGTTSSSKALVVDASKNISEINSLSASSLTSTAGSLTMGATTISESEIVVLDAVVPGIVSLSKAVVVDANKDIASFRNLTALNLTGTLQTAAQPNITSVGSLTSLTVGDDITLGGDLILNGTTLTGGQTAYLANATLGTALPFTTLIVDEFKEINGIQSLTATNLIGTSVTGTLQTAYQPNVASVNTLDITLHNGTTQGLKLGGVLLTATATQINSIFGAGGEGTFENLTVNDTLTLANADGLAMGLVLGSTLVTATGTELNYVDTTPGHAQPSKALVFDANINIDSINSLTATSLTGTLQTAAQPNVTSVNTLDITSHNGTTQGLKLGGVLLTATATQINSIFGAGGEGTFQNLTVNDTLTLANADGSTMGLVLGSTLVTVSGTELNYLDGSVPGTASASNVLVLDANKNIAGIHALSADQLTGTLQTAAQPNITSVGTLTTLAVAGDVTIGSTILSESEIVVLDAATPGTVSPSKVVVVDVNKDIASFRNLTALNLIATGVTGTLQTAAQPNITSVGELTTLTVAGDVTVGGNLNVGGTFISESEIVALDQAIPGQATALKAMITNSGNSITGINSLSAVSLTGTLQTAAQPNITSVGELTTLTVVGDVSVGGNLNVGGTFISESEIIALDAAVPGHASALKAMITDSNNSIADINSLSATSLVGTLQTAAQPNISSVTILNVTSHDGATTGISLGGTLVTASASELNYVDTIAGTAQASKALVLDASKNISGINNVSLNALTTVTESITSSLESTSFSTGALIIAGGVGIAKRLNVGGAVDVVGTLSIHDTTDISGRVILTNVDESTSASTGALTVAGGVGITKSLFVEGNADVVGDVLITGETSHAGNVTVTNVTESTAPTNGSIVTNGGVGITKSLNVGIDAAIGGDLSVNGSSELTGNVSVLSVTDSTSIATGSIVTVGGVGVAKSLYVGNNASVAGDLAVIGNITQSGSVSITNVTDSSSISTGSLVTAGGVGIAKNLNVGGATKITSVSSSTTKSTGALVVAGGVGIGENLNVGGYASIEGNANVDGNIVVDGTSTSAKIILTPIIASTAVFQIKALSEYVLNESGVGYQWNNDSSSSSTGVQLMQLDSTSGLVVNTNESITDITDSSSSITGALKVAGGVGILKNLNVGANTALTGTLAVTGGSTLSGLVGISNTTDASSVSTGSIVTTGGVGIAKSLYVGNGAFVGGDIGVTGMTTLTGSVSVVNVTESTSIATGSIVTAGGVGIAKSLQVGVDATIGRDLDVLGVTSLSGNVDVLSVTESTSTSTGAVVVAGGVGIAKSLHVGINADIGGNLNVVGTSSITGMVSISDTTESTNYTTGSLNTDGGAGIAKNLNVGGITTIANATPSTSILTGALVVGGGVGVSSDVNIGGDVGIAGDLNLAGDFDINGALRTTNVSLYPDASSPFSTLPLTNITGTDSIIALNEDAGIGYVNSAAAIVAIPDLVVTTSLVLYAPNSTSDWSSLALKGSALTTYNATYSGYGIRIRQLVVSSWSGKIWLAGAFFTGSASVAVVLSGDLTNGINNLYVVGSASTSVVDIECIRIAVSTDDNYIVVIRKEGSGRELYRMNISSSSTFASVLSGAFVSVAWLGGLGKFVATRTATSAIYCSTDASGSTWVDSTTPSGVAPNTVYYNMTINLAVAVGPDFIWYSNNATTWSVATYPSLASGDLFNAVVNSPVSGLIVIYSNTNNSITQLYYSTDAINYTAVTLTGASFGSDTPLTSAVAISPSSYAFAINNIASIDTIQRIGPITSASMIYSVGVSSGYLKNETAIGYEWYNNSTPTTVGDEMMKLTSEGLVVKSIVDIENSTNSNTSTSGSLVTTGGVGIAKNLNVGMDVSIGGVLSIAGSFSQNGQLSVLNSTDSVSTSTGAIITTGGVGIAKALNVGTNAAIGGALTVGSASTLIGSVSISSAIESSSNSVGSLTTAGGVGIGKSLNVGLDARIGQDLTIDGMTVQYGMLNVLNSTQSGSTSTGSIVTAGGVGIAKNLNVGNDTYLTGLLDVIGTASFDGIVSVDNVTESTSISSGALQVDGGVGIVKSIYVGNNASINGALNVTGTTTLGDGVVLSSITDSVSSSTGSLVTGGGVGIAKSLYVGVNASVAGTITIGGISTITATADSSSVTTGSFTTAGGVGIAKSLYVGTGIYGTIQTAAQPNISSVNILNITGANTVDAGLSLAGVLITATASEINYLDGSIPGTAVASKALVLNVSKDISGINALSASTLTGAIQTAAQPLITSVTTLDITGHNGVDAGLKLGGTLVTVSAGSINSLFAGTSNITVVNETVQNNLTLSGANGSTIGLVLGSTLVTATGTELNYVDTTPGIAEASKALVFNSDTNISGINALSASTLTGTIQTASQPLITSVNVLDVAGHNGSTIGLSLNGVLITSTADELNYVDTTQGSAQASKALVLNASKGISGITSLSATSLTGTLQTAAQPNITSVGTLTSLQVASDITMGSTVLSETDLAKIDLVTNGTAAANKALVLDGSKGISGITTLSSNAVAIGSPTASVLPLEVGYTSYTYTGSYAYNNDQNGHGIVDAGMGTSANYSLRTDGRILCTGEIEITSDRRMKHNIAKLTSDMSKKFIMTTTPVKFNWKTGDQIIDYGYIAQDVLKAGFTDLVTVTSQPGMEGSVEEDGFVNPQDAKFVFSPGKIIPMLALNQRDVFKQLEEKDEQIADLETRLAKLEEMISKMI